MIYRLSELCKYRSEKILIKDIDKNNYVSTDNMLPNFSGIGELKSFPNVDKVNKYYNGDILLSNIRPYFKKMILAKTTSGCSTDVLVFQVDTDLVNPKFLFYRMCCDDFFDYVILTSKGTKMPRGDKEAIMNYELDIPSQVFQEKIVKILESIESKIELNNKINNNLYELSQKIYNQWFVDFEYPINIHETYKSNGGGFKEEYGIIIPETFKVCKLDEICDCQNGHAFYKEGYDDAGLMVIDLGNVSLQGNFIYTNADKYINRSRIPNEKFVVKKNDLVMIMTDRKATMDLLGKTAKIYEDKEFALNQRIYRVRPSINVNYVYSFLNSNSTLDKLKSVALGSVQKYINTNYINDLKIIVPSIEIMNGYSKIVDPIFKRMEENILENMNLEIIKDTLLPKLMNGEIDLDNVKI